MTTIDILKKTRAARGELAVLDEAGKNALLLSMADSLLSHEGAILAENEADMSDARGHISDVMLDRLRLDHDRLAGIADGVRAIAALPDHTGRVLSEVRRPNGLVSPDDTEMVTEPAPAPGEGEALLRTTYVGIDAAARTWLDGEPGYLPALQLGEVVRVVRRGLPFWS